MLVTFVLLCTLCLCTEVLVGDSADNRVITPLVGFVLTVLVCARFTHASCDVPESPLHVVHVFLYIACLFYIRAMLDSIFENFIFDVSSSE